MSKDERETVNPFAETVELTESERHELLASRQRRLALDRLAERNAPVELADLAAEVAARADEADAIGIRGVSQRRSTTRTFRS